MAMHGLMRRCLALAVDEKEMMRCMQDSRRERDRTILC
jgi:hypothetical protein